MAATKRRRTKGAGGVFRDKAGKWHFRTEITADPGTGHRRIIETTGLVKSDARQRHENKLREYERTGIIHSNQSPYLRDYIIRWCGQRRRDLKPNTWYNLDKRCNIIADTIGGVRLAELTPAHVRLMMDRLGRTRAPRTVREYHGISNRRSTTPNSRSSSTATPAAGSNRHATRRPRRGYSTNHSPRN